MYLTVAAYVNTLLLVIQKRHNNKMLTTRRLVADDGDMKDKWLQVRVDDAIKSYLLELRRLEPDLPGDSEMVRRLIRRAAEAARGERELKRRERKEGK